MTFDLAKLNLAYMGYHSSQTTKKKGYVSYFDVQAGLNLCLLSTKQGSSRRYLYNVKIPQHPYPSIRVNPFMPNGIFHPCQLDDSIPNLRVVGLYLAISFKFKKYILKANSGIADLVLCCFPLSL